MSTLAMACQRRHFNPAWIIALLALAGLGVLAVAVIQFVSTAGPVLLAAGCLALAGWLAKVLSSGGALLGWLALMVLVAVCPWLGLAALLWLAVREAGEGDA